MKDYRQDIRSDFARLDNVISSLQKYWGAFGKSGEEDSLFAASAYQLQHLYNGLEKIMEKSLAMRGIKLTGGGSYHKDLLKSFFEHFTFTVEEQDFIVDLLSFRHFARSAYGFEVEGELIKKKVPVALARWPGIKNKIWLAMKLGN